MAELKSVLTDEVRAMIGASAEKVEAGLWGVEREDLRRFTQALMDDDPRYWDEAFAKTTRYGGIVAPPIYCTYLNRKARAGTDDPVSRVFSEDPESDGVRGLDDRGEGALPPLPTDLNRILNGGNDIEVYKYPTLGDRIFSQAKYADIVERVGKDGKPFLVVVTEITYTDQNGAELCVIRQSRLRR
jgi:hypothetical protein